MGINVEELRKNKTVDEILEELKELPPYRVLREGQREFGNVRSSYDKRKKAPFWRVEPPVLEGDLANPVVKVGGMFVPQRLVYENRSKVAVYLGGWGSGKTTTLVKKIMAMALTNSGTPCAIVAPSIARSNRLHVDEIKRFLTGRRINHRWVGSDKRYFEFKYQGHTAKLYCLSSHDPEVLKLGDNFGAMALDEPFSQHESVFVNSLSRLRAPAAYSQLVLGGTPEELGWGYGLCKNGFEGIEPYVVVASTLANTALPKHYVSSLIGTSDEKVFRAYVLGEFVNLSAGVVYYGFDETTNHKNFGDIGTPLVVGMDFNVNPMSACVGWLSNGHLHVFDEVRLPNADTAYMCETLRERYGDRIQTVYPDPSGNRRSATAKTGRTDFDVIRSFGYDISAPGQILRRDSENAVNSAFRPLSGPVKVSLHPKGCKKLTADLLELTHEKYAKQAREGKDHMPDALKYLVYGIFPPARTSTDTVIYGR